MEAGEPRAKKRLSEALATGQCLKPEQLKRLFGDAGMEVLYANVQKNEQGEIAADQLIEWLYGECQGAKKLPLLGPHLEVPGVATGGDSPSAKSGSFSPRHCRTEQDIEKFGMLSLGFMPNRMVQETKTGNFYATPRHFKSFTLKRGADQPA
eukprot:Skav209182  [mRNA]  locus=scaffold1137:549360:550113:- [translate_table: standard]